MLTQLIASVFLFTATPSMHEPIEILPGVLVADGFVEFTSQVSIDCHHPDTPDVFLEMILTAPDSREHESLFVTSIKPSILHAALLAAGFNAGEPIEWGSSQNEHTTKQATGDRLRIFYSVIDDTEPDVEFLPAESLVIDIESRQSLIEYARRPDFVFSGSSFTSNGYAADRSGSMIAITPFGDEVISPTWTLSPQADIDEPIWIAHNEIMPEKGTPVRIRILVIETDFDHEIESHQPDGIDIDRSP